MLHQSPDFELDGPLARNMDPFEGLGILGRSRGPLLGLEYTEIPKFKPVVSPEIIDDFVLVSEKAIAEGVRTIAHKHHNMIEGAAGTAVAAFMDMARTQPARLGGKNVVIVLCGANIDPEVLRGIL